MGVGEKERASCRMKHKLKQGEKNKPKVDMPSCHSDMCV